MAVGGSVMLSVVSPSAATRKGQNPFGVLSAVVLCLSDSWEKPEKDGGVPAIRGNRWAPSRALLRHKCELIPAH